MFCTGSAVAYKLIINDIKYKSQNTDDKNHKKKQTNRNKKTIINYARKRTCTATYVLKHS